MDPNVISIGAVIVAIIAVIVAFARNKTEVNPATINTAIQAIPSVVAEVEKAATIVVNSYEQARRKSKVELTPELSGVVDEVRSWLPEAVRNKVTNAQVIDAINSAILLASAASAQIAASKAVAAGAATDLPSTIPPRLTPPLPPPRVS